MTAPDVRSTEQMCPLVAQGTGRDGPMTFQPGDLTPDRSARDHFGAEVRRHREKEGKSLRGLADVLNYSKSHLARIEKAESLPYEDLAAKLDAHFGTGKHFVRLYAAARNDPLRIPNQYRPVFAVEKLATVIEAYENALVKGLIQTAEYARHGFHAGLPYAPEAEIEAMVRFRMGRQALLRGYNPPRCWFILDEIVLRRPQGGREVMHRQMAKLVKCAAQAHITIQILPFAAGEHGEMGSSLSLYTVPDRPLAAYREGAHWGAMVKGANAVAERRDSFEMLRAMALSPRDSEAMIRAAMEDWKPC
ncbi:helix-turn-helix domain-containing protein [Streptomyces sp. P1-3]|uniref:helix-turn-helix domain-containing protein n=1 Tax=Streptomyces sp. P1-3 TaxID=3421658 RepID=UPI003D35F27D